MLKRSYNFDVVRLSYDRQKWGFSLTFVYYFFSIGHYILNWIILMAFSIFL